MNNPAKRLLQILNAGKSSDINVQADCMQVWKKILGVPGNDDAQLLSRLGKTIALVSEIEDEIKQIEGVEAQSLLAWVPLLKNALASQSMGGPWAGFISKVDNDLLNYLSNCSAILDINFKTKSKYKEIQSVDDLSEEISTLLKEMIESDLPDAIRSFMSLKLREIQRALDEYHITGNGPIVKAIESYYGYLLLNRAELESAKDNAAFKKFGRFMNGAAVLVTVTMGALQLPDEIKEYFPDDSVIEVPSIPNDSESGINDNDETIIT